MRFVFVTLIFLPPLQFYLRFSGINKVHGLTIGIVLGVLLSIIQYVDYKTPYEGWASIFAKILYKLLNSTFWQFYIYIGFRIEASVRSTGISFLLFLSGIYQLFAVWAIDDSICISIWAHIMISLILLYIRFRYSKIGNISRLDMEQILPTFSFKYIIYCWNCNMIPYYDCIIYSKLDRYNDYIFKYFPCKKMSLFKNIVFFIKGKIWAIVLFIVYVFS